MNLNKVFLIGRLAADPESRTTPTGQQVTSVRIATNRVWNDKNGQKQEQVEFHSIVCWGGLADISQKYLKKGQLAFFEGRLQTRSWQDASGQKHYRTEIVAETMQLGPKAMGTGSQSGSYAGSPGRSSKTDEIKEDEILIIEEDAPIASPITKSSGSDVEESEIDLKDIPF